MKALADHGSETSGAHTTTQTVAAAQIALSELPDALLIAYDEDMRFVQASGQVLERLGSPPAYSPGEPLGDAFPAPLWSTIEPLLRSALQGETRSREIWTEQERCLAVDVGPVPMQPDDESPATPRGMAVLIDATQRRRAELLASRDGFEEVFDRAPLGTGLLDHEGRWLLVNRALCDITGYTFEELVGKRFDGIVHPDDAYAFTDARTRLLSGVPALTLEIRYFDASGETVVGLLAISLVRDRDGQPLHYIAQLQDISDRRKLEDQLRRLADHDELTGVRSRGLFLNDLHLQVARCRRYGEVAGLIVIDIDGMQALNATHGREAGDLALTAVARALMRRLRQTDLVARAGGDEFAVLLPHIDAEGLAVVVEGVERVIAACGVDVGDMVVHPRAAVGSTLLDEQTADAQRALDAAVRSMHGVAPRP